MTKKPKKFNLKSFVIGALRRATYKLPSRGEAMKRARTRRGFYKCAMCGEEIRTKDVRLDHVNPVVDVKDGFVDWNTYIPRMLPESADSWQVLHKSCHDVKTFTEKELRKVYRAKRKVE